MIPTHEEIGRNEFDLWCWLRGLELRDVADDLALVAEGLKAEGRYIKPPSIETVRLIRLPFSDPKRRVPGGDLLELINRYTAREILPAHFYPEHLRGTPVTQPEAVQ